MPRNSFRDAATQVLTGHGFTDRNRPGDIVQAEADTFSLTPGQWQWNGTAWIPFTPPPTQDEQDQQDFKVKAAAVLADATIPQNLRDFIQATRNLLKQQ